MQATDEALFEMFVAGDQTAFAEVYARYAPKLTSFVYSKFFAPDHQLAEDVVQKTFDAVRHAKDTGGMKLKPWLFSSAFHRAFAVARPITITAKPSLQLPEAMAKLGPINQQIVEAVYVDGLSIPAAAEKLGLEPRILAGRLRRAAVMVRVWGGPDLLALKAG